MLLENQLSIFFLNQLEIRFQHFLILWVFKGNTIFRDHNLSRIFQISNSFVYRVFLEENLNGVYKLLKDGRGQDYEVFVNGIPVSENEIVSRGIRTDDDVSIATEELGTIWAVENLNQKLIDILWRNGDYKDIEIEGKKVTNFQNAIKYAVQYGITKNEKKLITATMLKKQNLFPPYSETPSYLPSYISGPQTMTLEVAEDLLKLIDQFINEKTFFPTSQDNSWEQLDYYQKAKEDLEIFLKYKKRLLGKTLLSRNVKYAINNPHFFADLYGTYKHGMFDFTNYLRKIKTREGGFESWVIEAIVDTPVDKYNTISDLSKVYTTHFDLDAYQTTLFPKLNNKKSGLILENDHDKKILKLLNKLADPDPKSYNIPDQYVLKSQGQPHHHFLVPAAFNNRKKNMVVATEVPVYIKNDKTGELLTGHIDMVVIIGKNIYICDYKPERDFSSNPAKVDKIFADTIPQVATYAIIFKHMFKKYIDKGGFNVFCYTFNNFDGKITNPEKALAAYTDFYETYKPLDGDPPWKWLLSL